MEDPLEHCWSQSELGNVVHQLSQNNCHGSAPVSREGTMRWKATCQIGLLALGLALAKAAALAQEGTLLQTFTIKEQFGVSHPDQIIDFDFPTSFDPANSFVIGPGGVEVPYQLLRGDPTTSADDKIAVQARLPKSIFSSPTPFPSGWVSLAAEAPPSGGLWFPYGSPVTVGEVIQIFAADGRVPGGIVSGRDYHVVAVNNNNTQIVLSERRNGPPVSITSRGGESQYLMKQTAAVEGNQFYVRSHEYRNGDALRFRSSGTLPAPLQPGATYYAWNVTPDFLQIATDSSGGNIVSISSPGSGIHEVLSEWSWQLRTGRPPAVLPTSPMSLSPSDPAFYEISNGKTGVRINRAGRDAALSLAPVQGVRLADGRWAATGPNSLFGPAGGNLPTAGPTLRATNLMTQILENGPLKVVVQNVYLFDRKAWSYPGGCSPHNPPACFYFPAGVGFYTNTIVMEAGQPSILLEEDTNMELLYALNLQDAIPVDQGRYRGHHATTLENGYDSTGATYQGRGDATREFTYNVPLYDGQVTLSGATYRVVPRTLAWDPWCYDTGWYWMLYAKNGGGPAPVVGMFANRPSRAIGANVTGPGVFALPNDGSGRRAAGIRFQANHSGADQNYSWRHRISWGLFVGNQADSLLPATAIQPIALQKNIHGGISLNKVHRVRADFADQAGAGSFMEPSVIQGMIARLRQGDRAYYDYLYNADPTARDIVDAWKDATGVRTRGLVQRVGTFGQKLLNAMVNKDGIHEFEYTYWNGASQMAAQAFLLSLALADPVLDAIERERAHALAGLFATILWDDDFVPINFQEHQLNAGTANMPVQYGGLRNQLALTLPNHPIFQPRLGEVAQNALTAARGIINPYGAEIGSPHYMGASAVPTIQTLLQLRSGGVTDPFATEPRLARFGEFAMQLLTPPEVRFGGSRKSFAAGHGSTEGNFITGLLATGFRTADPVLSSRLMGAWRQGGKVHSGFYNTSLVMIDENAPWSDPRLLSANFPGYMSVARQGWGTPRESALWLLNGDYYSDHRNDDRGSMTLYTHSAPLTVSWGALYYPDAWGGSMKSMVMPLSAFPSWNQNSQALDTPSGWSSSTNETFAAFTNSTVANARMIGAGGLVWTRTVQFLNPNPDLPVVVVRDDFAGANPSQAKVVSFNLMADGPVATPAGAITPAKRTYNYNGTPKELPSAGSTFNLAAGLNRLGFTGQTWNAHPTRGIDWDVYLLSTEALSGNIGNWGHSWHPGAEAAEFQAANGRAFEERQHILRIKGNGTFRTYILPWRKGEKPPDLQVTASGAQVTITTGGSRLVIDDNSFTYTNAQKRVLTTFSTNAVSALGFTLSGGPTELVLENSRAFVTSHGGRARRTLTGPPDWNVASVPGQNLPAKIPLEKFQFDYDGTKPQTIILE